MISLKTHEIKVNALFVNRHILIGFDFAHFHPMIGRLSGDGVIVYLSDSYSFVIVS